MPDTWVQFSSQPVCLTLNPWLKFNQYPES